MANNTDTSVTLLTAVQDPAVIESHALSSSGTAVPSISVTVNSPVPGSIYVSIMYSGTGSGSGSLSISSVTDNHGNTYTHLLTESFSQFSNTWYISMYNFDAASAVATTITATFNTPTPSSSAICAMFINNIAEPSLDHSFLTTGAGSTITDTITVSQIDSLVYMGAVTSPGSIFTNGTMTILDDVSTGTTPV